MTLTPFFARYLPVLPGEGRLSALLFIHLFANALALIFLDTAVAALFFERFSPTAMAWVYLALGGVFVGVGFLYSRLEKRLDPVRFLGGILALSVLITAVLYGFYLLTRSGAALGLLLMWKEVMRTLFALEFGLAASFLLDIRQSKRLLPMVMGGSFLAAILGGAAIPALLNLLPVEHLLFLGVIFSAGAYGSFRLLFAGRILPPRPTAPARENMLTLLWNNPFTRISTLLGSILSGGVLFFLAHYLFYGELRAAYPDKTQMAAFLGMLYSWANLFNLLMAFVGARLLSRFGILFGVALLPIALFVIASLSGLLGLLGFAAALFHGAVLIMFADRTVRLSIENAAYRTLYQITPTAMRLRSIGFRENIVKPLSLAATAGLALLITEVWGFDPVALYGLLALAAALSIWMIAAHFKIRYREALFRHIERRSDEGIVYDDNALSLLREKLVSDNPVEAAYALEILSRNGNHILKEPLKAALVSPHVLLRIKAAQVLSSGRWGELDGTVKKRAQAEENPQVLAALLGALPEDDQSQALLEKRLEHPVFAVSAAAFGGLTRRPSGRGYALALVFLADRLEADDANAYALIAQNPAVHCEPLLTVLFEKLDNPDHRFKASHAIAAFGEMAVQPLIERFKRARFFEKRLFFLKLITRANTPSSLNFLQTQLYVREPELKNAVYETLAKTGYRHKKRAEIRDLITQEMDRTANLAAFALRLEKTRFGHLRGLIAQAIEASVNRIFWLLSLAYGAQRVDPVRAALRKGTAQEKSYALELVDSMIGLSERQRFMNLIETGDFETKIRLIANNAIKTRHDALNELLLGSGFAYVRWLTASAVYALENVAGIDRYARALQIQAQNDSAWVREAVCRVAGARNLLFLTPQIAQLRHDEDLVVAEMAAWAYEKLITGAIDENHP